MDKTIGDLKKEANIRNTCGGMKSVLFTGAEFNYAICNGFSGIYL